MTFEDDYSVILERATIAARTNELDISPEEVISNVYIKLFDDPEYQYDFFSFDKALNTHCKYVKKQSLEFIPYTDHWKKSVQHVEFKSQKVCTVCKETKNSSEFKVKTDTHGKKYQRGQCDNCYNSWRHKYNKENKEKAALRWKRYRENDPVRVGKLIKNNGQARTKSLTDNYIKTLLHQRYSHEYVKDNPEIIEQHRKKIIAKRNKKIINKIKEYKENKL